MVTSNDIGNQALLLIGNNYSDQPVTGQNPTWDDSVPGQVLKYLYTPAVQTVFKQFEYEFTRNTVDLILSGNVAPPEWALEYIYPSEAVEVWQILPAFLGDPNNPMPVNWVIANNIVAGQQIRVIQTNIANAQAVIDNAPNENAWDAEVREVVVRFLASELAIALAGKPETSTVMYQTGAQFSSIARERNA